MKKLILILTLFIAYSAIGQTYTVNTQVRHNDSLFLKTITYTYHFDSTLKYVPSQYLQQVDDTTTIVVYDTVWYYQKARVIDNAAADSVQINRPSLASLGITEVGRNLAALSNPASSSAVVVQANGSAVLRTAAQFLGDIGAAAATHNHVVGDVTGLQAALDGKQTSLGFTPLNPANNLSEVTPATARTNLGLVIGTNVLAPNGSAALLTNFPILNQNTTGTAGGLSADIPESRVTNLVSDLAAKQATLVSNTNIKTVNSTTLLGSGDIVTTRKVAQADIASTASATATTTLFTPSADGFYRVAIYLKITTTGTSPVAGPVTITYTSADGSVAQSHVMLLQSVTGAVVTTTVNNSTTTGTVNGTMVIYAKAGVAIQYAIAVSGTFGAGRYMAHLFCEQL